MDLAIFVVAPFPAKSSHNNSRTFITSGNCLKSSRSIASGQDVLLSFAERTSHVTFVNCTSDIPDGEVILPKFHSTYKDPPYIDHVTLV